MKLTDPSKIISDEILKRLDVVALKMNTTAEKLWPVLVREIRIEAAVYLFISVVLFLVSIGAGVGAALLFAHSMKCGGSYRCPDAPNIIGLVLSICAVVAFGTSLLHLDTLSDFLAPEGKALRRLLGSLK